MQFKYVFGGIVLFLIFLLATTPANLVFMVVKKQLPGIELNGLSGSVWQGSLDEISIKQQGRRNSRSSRNTLGSLSGQSLRNVGWTFNFFALLTGKLGADLTLVDPKAKGSLKASINLSGVPQLNDVQLKIPLKEVAKFVPVSRGMELDLQGSINTNLSSVVITGNEVTELLGTAKIKSLSVKFGGRRAFVNLDQSFGDYDIQFKEVLDKNLAFDIKGVKDVLSLQASGSLAKKLVEVKGSVSDNLPPQLGILNAMLKPQGPGRKSFEYKWRLPI